MTQNTLELARQGDPTAIAMILTYYLSHRSDTTASAIRLGNYLSVLIDASFTPDQDMLVNLVLGILRDLGIGGITVVEVSARQIGDHEVQWNQTIDLITPLIPPSIMISEPTPPALPENMTPASEAIAVDPDAINATSEDWETTLRALIQRPEMVALIAFALLLVLWDTYMDWMADIDLTQPLSTAKLARRLGITSTTLKRFRNRANFSEWSQDLDPAGIAWKYENKVFVPEMKALLTTPTL